MKKHLLLVGALLSCLGTAPSMAQQSFKAVKGTNEAASQKVAAEISRKQEANYKKSLELAQKHGWVLKQSFKDGSSMALKGVDERGMPLYDITYSNAAAAATTATSPLWPGGSSGLNLSGSSPALAGKIGVFDEPVLLTHQELAGRVIQVDGPLNPGSHGTHVSGTMIASGINPLAKGMAFGAQLLRAWNFQGPATTNMATHAASLLVSNHSYGTVAGWRNNTARAGTATDPTWEWWGDISLTPADPANPATDWKFGFYDTQARTWDQIAYNAPYYLIVKSSGNNRSQVGPNVGAPFWARNANGTYTLMNRPEGISSNNGYDIISTYGNSKNIMTVGAVNAIPDGYKQPSDVVISSFSSWGPTDDGRIKPDIVGNGVGLLSSYTPNNNSYAAISGTSMSAPNVSGSLVLLQEHYSNLHNGDFMLASTLKGLVLHTADEAGRPGPDYIYGWGLMNTERAAKVISEKGSKHKLEERNLAQNEVYTFQVTASGKGPLVATISWTDPEGEVLSLTAANVNNRTPRLVNDLDIRISDGSNTYKPWILDPERPDANATTGDNFRDNVEQVFIADAVPGKTYTVTVSHKGTLQRGPQAYALIVSGIGGTAYCSSAAQSNEGARIDAVTLGSFTNTSAEGCHAYRDFTNLTATAELKQVLPLSVKAGSCSGQENMIVKAYIDWNADGDFDDSGELVATSGILTGGSIFTTNIPVPQHITPGNVSIMRIVLTETTNPSEVSACGTYAKGETQDYRIQFRPTSTDIGVAALVSPENICANTSLSAVTILLKNYGTAAQSNFPVQITLKQGSSILQTTSLTYTRTLGAYAEAEFRVPFTALTAVQGKNFTVEATTLLANDMDEQNNMFTGTIAVNNPAPAAVAAAYKCGNGPVSLQATADGTVFWYDAPTQGNLVGAGNQFTLTTPVAGNLYAAVNQFSGTIGRTYTPTAATGQNFSNNGVVFNAQVPLVIESIRMRTAGTGTISIGVTTAAGTVISSVNVQVDDASPTTATEGAIVPLNLVVPSPGNGYRLTVLGFTGTAGAWRDNLGATQNAGYPFTINHVMTITGSTATDNGFYHFMYEIKVKAAGCASETRIEVSTQNADAAVASITPAGATTFCDGNSVVLQANEGQGLTYQWFRGGTAIAGATSSTYTAERVANTILASREVSQYSVRVTNPNGCNATSELVTVTIDPASPAVNLISTTSPQLCAGTTPAVVMEAITGINANLLQYKWMRNGQVIEGATGFSYTATSAGTYQVEVSRTPCDAKLSAELVVTAEDATLATHKGIICGTEGSTVLTAQANHGTVFWYDAPAGGNLLAVGNQFTTPLLNAPASYYAGINDYAGVLGSASNSTGGGFTNFSGGRMYFDADIPFILEKVTMNVSTAGTTGARTATIIVVDKDFSNAIIASRTIAITPGINEYTVNLFIPSAGKNYGIQVSAFGGGATAYRNNTSGSANYPFTLPGVVSLTGNNQTTPSSFYYFLYDWKVKAAGCATAKRSKVDVEFQSLPTATLSGSTSVCPGASATLSVALTGVAPFSITYTDGTTPVTVSGVMQNNYQFNVSHTTATTYNLLSVSDAKAVCNIGTVSGTAHIAINPVPGKPVITASGSTTISEGSSVTLTAPADMAGYKWSTGETTRSITVKQAGFYTVIVSNGLCESPVSDVVQVVVTPQAGNSGNTPKGIAEKLAAAELVVFPNPANSFINIEYKAEQQNETVQAQIINMQGIVLSTITLHFDSGIYRARATVSALPKGSYFVRVVGAQHVTTARFVKQ